MEARDFTGLAPRFAELDAEVLGCSPDGAQSHRKFIAKFDLGIRLLCDPDKAMMGAYDAFGEKTMYGKKVQGVKRSTVLIDAEGRVAHHFQNVRAKGHADQVLARLAELRS